MLLLKYWTQCNQVFAHQLQDLLWEILQRWEPDGDIENTTVPAPIVHHHQGSWEIENRPQSSASPDTRRWKGGKRPIRCLENRFLHAMPKAQKYRRMRKGKSDGKYDRWFQRAIGQGDMWNTRSLCILWNCAVLWWYINWTNPCATTQRNQDFFDRMEPQ